MVRSKSVRELAECIYTLEIEVGARAHVQDYGLRSRFLLPHEHELFAAASTT